MKSKKQQPRRSKNWKLWAGIFALISAGSIIATTVSLVSCGTNNRSEVIKTDLADLNLEATVAVDLSATPEEVFQAFLDKNQSILDNTLTLDHVELSDFQASEYLKNGSLMINAKKVPTNKWTGTIQLAVKYILHEKNFPDFLGYLSDNDLLKFEIPAGTITSLGNLVEVFKETLNNKMKQYYEYESNITEIRVKKWAWNFPKGIERPSIEDLNTKGYTVHLPRFRGVFAIDHRDGHLTKIDKHWNVYWTIV